MSVTLDEETEAGLEQTRKQASHNQLNAAPGTRTGQVEYVPAGSGRSYKSPIDQVTFLLTGKQTGGAFFMMETIVPPACGNPPHIHDREDETFYIKQGTLTVQVGDQTVKATEGDVVKLPRGLVHCFQNNGDLDAKVLIVIEPAGLETFFEEAFYPAADWQDAMPPMNDEFMARLLPAAAKCGLKFLPPA